MCRGQYNFISVQNFSHVFFYLLKSYRVRKRILAEPQPHTNIPWCGIHIITQDRLKSHSAIMILSSTGQGHLH